MALDVKQRVHLALEEKITGLNVLQIYMPRKGKHFLFPPYPSLCIIIKLKVNV